MFLVIGIYNGDFLSPVFEISCIPFSFNIFLWSKGILYVFCFISSARLIRRPPDGRSINLSRCFETSLKSSNKWDRGYGHYQNFGLQRSKGISVTFTIGPNFSSYPIPLYGAIVIYTYLDADTEAMIVS